MEVLRLILYYIVFAIAKTGDFVIGITGKSREFVFALFRKVKTDPKLPIGASCEIFDKRKLKKKPFLDRYRKHKLKKKARRKQYYSSLFGFKYKLRLFFYGVSFSLIFIFLPVLFFIFSADLPSVYTLSDNFIPKTTRILDRNGSLLYEIYSGQDRTIVKLDNVPISLRQATIAIEDRNFYRHAGFDLKSIFRAFVNNIKGINGLQGGSTITQQLIKSALLTSEPTIGRKLKEISLAFLAERIYSKEKILELYFNFVPYGGTAWGVQAASQVYFGKNVSELNLAQSSFLAGLPKAPTSYSPFEGELWKGRQKEVLDAMVHEHFITQDTADKAFQENLIFKPRAVPIKAPHFVMYIKKILVDKYGLSTVERGGLTVKTTLDLPLQEMAQAIVSSEVSADSNLNIKNGGALISNPINGDILAMVGNKDYFDKENDGNVNITTALRQPGSSIKIVTYALALANGFTEATSLDDSPLIIKLPEGNYSPVNYDGKYHGFWPLRYAFANSLNIPAVRTAKALGVKNIVSLGHRLGISSWTEKNNYGLSITLGGADVSMLDMSTVYGVIANSGKRVDLNPILEIDDFQGKSIYGKTPLARQVVDQGVAFIISNILADNNARSLEFGYNSPLKIDGHFVSVKTGTSDNKRDNWTIGFTKNYVVSTWVGNYDNSPMSQTLASGITGAAPIWHKIMTNLLANTTDKEIALPENVVKKFCLGAYYYFIKGTENSVNCVLPKPNPTPTAGSN